MWVIKSRSSLESFGSKVIYPLGERFGLGPVVSVYLGERYSPVFSGILRVGEGGRGLRAFVGLLIDSPGLGFPLAQFFFA